MFTLDCSNLTVILIHNIALLHLPKILFRLIWSSFTMFFAVYLIFYHTHCHLWLASNQFWKFVQLFSHLFHDHIPYWLLSYFWHLLTTCQWIPLLEIWISFGNFFIKSLCKFRILWYVYWDLIFMESFWWHQIITLIF